MHSSEDTGQAHNTTEGLVTRPSPYTVAETIARIEAALQQHELTLFALVDHSGEAAAAGLTLRPTKLLIFGSPAAGTPLMVAAPLVALDLPLKALVWQEDSGEVVVSYNSTGYLAARHHLRDALLPNIAGIDGLIGGALSQ